MQMTFYDWIFTILLGLMLYDSIARENSLKCGNQPINFWMIGTIAIAFLVRVIFHIRSLAIVMPTIIVSLANFLLIMIVILTPIWNLLGTIWVLINAFYGNRCLKTIALLIILSIQAVIYLSLSIVFYALYEIIRKYYHEEWQKDKVVKKLNNIYTNNKRKQKFNANKFVKNYKVILQSLPLLEIEIKLIEDLCSYTVVDASSHGECGICLNKIIKNDIISKIQCEHVFHYDCLIGWYKIKPFCPFCRKPFREELILKYLESLKVKTNPDN